MVVKEVCEKTRLAQDSRVRVNETSQVPYSGPDSAG